jgi:riboflavin synthase alpha subunit
MWQEEANEIMKKREGDKKNIEHDILRKIVRRSYSC